MEVVASLSQGRTAAAQCGLFTHKSVPVIFEPPCIFPHYLIKGAIFGKKIIECKMSVLMFSMFLLEKILIVRRVPSDIIINVQASSRKVCVILVRY